MYGFDLFSTPDRDRELDEAFERWLAAQRFAAEALVVGHGV